MLGIKNTVSHSGLALGISKEEFMAYAGGKIVTALHIYKAERLEHEVTFGAKPPQNWGRFAATYRDTPKREEEAQ